MTTPIHKTKKDVAVEIIREAILSGELVPGERLLQDELAERLNVSPTPIREALRELEAEGILDYIPHKGVQVTEAKLENIQEIYLMRSALESLATRSALPNIDYAKRQQLINIQAEIDSQIEKNNLETLRKLNYQLHMHIYDSSEMPQLCHIIRILWTKFPWDTLNVIQGRAQVSAEQHWNIIWAIKDGNAELASSLIKEHIESAAAALTKYLEEIK